MKATTEQLNAPSNLQHGAEQLELPILRHLGALTVCRKAIDMCAASRVGVAVVGPKGSGKSAGAALGSQWFAGMERAKFERDDTYSVRRILPVWALSSKTDRDLALFIARKLTRTYSPRAGGRQKSIPEIRADILEMCRKRQYAVILIDEADTYSDAALEFLRDLLADSQDNGSGRVRASGTIASGIGLLLVGDDTLRERLGSTREAGHRWRQVLEVQALETSQLTPLYAAWFPGFQPHVEAVGAAAWQNYLASVLCRGEPLSLRKAENQARVYAHYYFRADPALKRETIPFDRSRFEVSAEECAWAADIEAAPPVARTPKRGRGRGAS